MHINVSGDDEFVGSTSSKKKELNSRRKKQELIRR